MLIQSASHADYPGFLELAHAAIQPPGADTRLEDDRPLLLGPDNRPQVLIIKEEGRLVAGLAFLVRQFETSCGRIPVAAIGAVVTDASCRNRGLSRRLQDELLRRLDGADIPLAVLWTDQPEVYAGRGFRPAGWEHHLNCADAELASALPPGFVLRRFEPDDTPAVEALYRRHPLRTVRLPGDSAKLYGMSGTQGLLACGDNGGVAAAIFCGKGADFPHYITEFEGPKGLVAPLLFEARRRMWAHHLLLPAGEEAFREHLLAAGASCKTQPVGLWSVVQPAKLSRYIQGAGLGAPKASDDPAAWLGSVQPDGKVRQGVLAVAVWGFDSV